MADQWYYQLLGEVSGPVTFAKLRDLVRSGTLTSSDAVRTVDAESWTLVSELDWGTPSSETTTRNSSKPSQTVGSVDDDNSTSDRWYCLLGDSVFGPWTFEELTLFAQSEQLKSTDEVKLGDDGKWRKVGSIGRLMALLPYEEQEKKAIGAAASGPRTSEREGEETDTSSRKQESKADVQRRADLAPVFIKTKSDSRKSQTKKPLAKPLSSLQRPLSALKKKTRVEPSKPQVDDDGPLIRDADQSKLSRHVARRPERSTDSAKDATESNKASLFDDSYQTPTPGSAPKQKPLAAADDEFELATETVMSANSSKPPVQATVNQIVAIPTQAAYNVAYEQAKAKIAQSMIAQAEASFKASEELAKSHVAWATAPTVDPFWYGWASGVEFGPVEFNQVFGLAKSGQLKPTDFVRNGQYSQFGPAGNIPGLFTAVAMVIQATETMNLAKSQAMTIASLAGYAPTAPVEAPNPVAATPETPPAAAAAMRASAAEISTTKAKSNPAVTAVGVRPNRSTAEVATIAPQAQETRKSTKSSPQVDVHPGTPTADGTQKPAPKRRPTSNPDVVAHARPATNADVKVKRTSATHGEMSTKDDASVAKSKKVPAAATSSNKPKGAPAKSKSNPKPSSWMSFFGGRALVGSRFKDPKSVGGLCALALFVLMFASQYLPKDRSADRGHYQAIKAVLDEIREARTKNPSELERLKSKLDGLGKDIATDLRHKANRYDPAKQYLLWVARDDIPRFLSAGFKDADSQTEKAIELRLREASYELGIEKRPPADPNLQFATN